MRGETDREGEITRVYHAVPFTVDRVDRDWTGQVTCVLDYVGWSSKNKKVRTLLSEEAAHYVSILERSMRLHWFEDDVENRMVSKKFPWRRSGFGKRGLNRGVKDENSILPSSCISFFGYLFSLFCFCKLE